MAGNGPWRSRGLSRANFAPDEQATQQFLKDYLFNKGLPDLEEEEDVSPGPGPPVVRHSDAGTAGSLKHSKALEASLRSKEATVTTVVIHESNPPARDPLELEKERMHVLSQVCGPGTRPDVQAWIEKIFLAQAAANAKEKRKRKIRASSAASESALSGQTGYTAYTGHRSHGAAHGGR